MSNHMTMQDWGRRAVIFQEVSEERKRQLEKYSPEHDDSLPEFGWRQLIKDCLPLSGIPIASARECFIQIAALAIAAVESIDRKDG